MKIMIVGGTGFLGYYTAQVALERGHEVGSLSLDDIDLKGWYPEEIAVNYGDVFELSEDELVPFFEGYDAMVYSVGPDDREVPPAPSREFFRERLVEHCAKVFRAARRAGVKRAVVYNSYFSAFDRMYPEKKLAEKHPYVGARVEQEERLLAENDGSMDIMILELPYIFGCMPQRTPLWKGVFIDRFFTGKTVFFPGGGTTMIHVRHVGEAGVGALERGTDGKRYPIGDENHTFKQMLEWFIEGLKCKKKVMIVNKKICAFGAGFIARAEKKHGLEAGLNYKYLMLDMMGENMFLDSDEIAAELGYGRGGVKEGIIEAMGACYPDGMK